MIDDSVRAITGKEWRAWHNHIPLDKCQDIEDYIQRFYVTTFNIKQEKPWIRVQYYEGRLIKYDLNVLSYFETTPFYNMFVLTPKRYLIDIFQPNNIWKATHIDDSIKEKFKLQERYEVAFNSNISYQDYILYCSSNPLNEKSIINKIVRWSTENKKLVVIKPHPFPTTNVTVNDIIDSNLDCSYIKIIQGDLTTLINQASEVWCYGSGIGIKAILLDKKVSYFQHSQFSNMNGGKVLSPEEAYMLPKVSEEDKLRYLSWFYHKLCLDLDDNKWQEKYEERLDTFYIKNKRTIREFLI